MSDEYDDEDSPLGALTSLSSPRAPLSREQMRTPDYIQKQLDAGRALIGEPDDIVRSFDAAKDARRRASQEKINIIRAATDRLTQSAPGGPGEINLPLLAAGAGFLSPVRGGSFFNSVGQASDRAIPEIEKGRAAQMGYNKSLSDLDMLRAQALEQAGGLDYDDLVKRLGLGQQMTKAATDAEVKRQNALSRQNALGRPMFKILAGVGLVKINPDGTHEIAVQSRDPRTDPKIKLAALRYIQGITKDYDFDSPDHRAAYENELADSIVQSGGTLDPKIIQSDLSSHGRTVRVNPPASPAPGSGGAAAAAPPAAGASPTPPSGGAPAATPIAETADPQEEEPATAAPPLLPGLPALPAAPVKKPGVFDAAAAKAAGRVEAELATKEAEKAREMADASAGTLSTIDALESINAPTSRLAPAQRALGSWAEALGLPAPKSIAKANNLTAFNAIATNVVLDKQTMQKGVQTEGDAQRMRDTFAQEKNPVEANKLIMRAAKAQAIRAMDQAAFADQWFDDHNKSRIGWKVAWQRHLRETPIVKRVNGKPMFFNEFLDMARNDPQNKDLPDLDALVIDDWRSIKDK